jgi:hypothetical protein
MICSNKIIKILQGVNRNHPSRFKKPSQLNRETKKRRRKIKVSKRILRERAIDLDLQRKIKAVLLIKKKGFLINLRKGDYHHLKHTLRTCTSWITLPRT